MKYYLLILVLLASIPMFFTSASTNATCPTLDGKYVSEGAGITSIMVMKNEGCEKLTHSVEVKVDGKSKINLGPFAHKNGKSIVDDCDITFEWTKNGYEETGIYLKPNEANLEKVFNKVEVSGNKVIHTQSLSIKGRLPENNVQIYTKAKI